MLYALLQILHVFVCGVLMFVVLLQQGKGGGMGAAFGGGGAAQVFGGRGAGNILTRATAVAAVTFMLTSVALAYKSSEGDRALRARAIAEEQHRSTTTRITHSKKTGAAPSSAPTDGPMTPVNPPAAPRDASCPRPCAVSLTPCSRAGTFRSSPSWG